MHSPAASTVPRSTGRARLGARKVLQAWTLVALLVGAGAQAKDPPLNVWSDPDWQVALLGLQPTAVRSVRWSEQLYQRQAGSAEPVRVSLRVNHLGFDDSGRLATLQAERQRRGERDERCQWRYQWGDAAQLQRIDEEGVAQPLWQRQTDAAARVAFESERKGAALQRTTIKLDGTGRELERVIEQDNKAAARVREKRNYHPNGVLKSLEAATQGAARTVAFDPLGRPVKITERDAHGLRVTQIRYPTPLTALYDDSGATLQRGGLRKYSRELTFRVRHAEEWQRAGEPLQPLSRRELRDGRASEIQTEFDDAGRPMLQRVLEGERVRCVTEWQYHASGLLSSSRSRLPDSDARCAGSPDIDVQIDVDAAGNWVRQLVLLTQPDGQRVRAAEHTREIEYR
jgi:hypothetical protein